MIGSGAHNLQPLPKFCTYGITIREISCGGEHSAFITNDNYLYCIGCNRNGQLGNGDSSIRIKNSPVLVESLINLTSGISSVSCGENHTVVCTQTGEVFSWGEGRFGALGVSGADSDQFSPR